ncbi:helix-turn-helix domain-containing protein [Chitinophaga sp. MM2321]|uniref:GlxA family transcriptional regulator n=1 Tax=Chitinophaga sp. MM2321 TaxID=3137178 RepID=UPI0032D5A93C
MLKISLLIYEDVVLSCVSGVLDILMGANQFLEQSGKPPAFQVDLVSEKIKNIQLSVPAQFICYKTLEDVTATDLILAPAFYGSPDVVLSKNQALVEWIKEMRAQGTEVGSLCLGSYFLAEAGVLAGKSCTSHWMAIADMRNRYPEIKVLSDIVMTDEDGVYTSGGAFSSLNLVLYLIEKFCGREVEIWASKMFSIDMDRVNQAYFAVFQGQRQHEDEEILKAQTYIEKHYHLQISIEEIAGQTSMSKRSFIRRFKSATKNTPLEYLQRVKIESAKKELEKSTENISSLMYNVGYNDVKTFRQVFKRITGLTPQDYRKKYSRVAIPQE